jgi:hypothetical protein
VEVFLIEKHRRFIAVHVRENSTSPWFRITFVYGEPRTLAQHVDLVQRLRNASLVPWLLISDFNEVMWGYEHFLVCDRPESRMAAFRPY